MLVSIPKGAIMSDISDNFVCVDTKFQFQKVRLWDGIDYIEDRITDVSIPKGAIMS